MTKKKQGMDEDALGGLFDSIDLVYEDDLPKSQAEEPQAPVKDEVPDATNAAVPGEGADETNEAPADETTEEMPE